MNTALATPVTGAPYAAGDVVSVEVADVWQDVTVLEVQRSLGRATFGLGWQFSWTHPTTGETHVSRCDDNGRNYTWRSQVCPSFATAE